ncbi:hypothetical protein GGX14DRAFT_389350 [Mycena pura]|uniref:Uncharacterized protein n=1 Tax=Mycena pura TaxID=153505 RepID=A0AAD6VQC3_9AGAR|nr:hypothetical protein GGX14DRAFT_389350 [Mycena pura]
MGRRQKHLTDEEQAAAKQTASRKYENSSRGKSAREQRDALRRIRRHTRQSPIPCLAPLPADVLSWACFSLLETEPIYQEALHAGFDNSPFMHWTEDPPFLKTNYVDPPYGHDTPEYWEHVRVLESAVHGIQMSDERRCEAHFREKAPEWGPRFSRIYFRLEVKERLERWEKLWDSYESHRQANDPLRFAMWEHLVGWLARSICRIYYLEFLK